jgi:hypothetical protein
MVSTIMGRLGRLNPSNKGGSTALLSHNGILAISPLIASLRLSDEHIQIVDIRMHTFRQVIENRAALRVSNIPASQLQAAAASRLESGAIDA